MTPNERIKQQASYYSGFSEDEDHSPISKGQYYGYIAGATATHDRAKVLVDALRMIAGGPQTRTDAVNIAWKALEQWQGKDASQCPHCGKELNRDRNLCCRECGKEVGDERV